jgi:hypothetical protein
MALSQNILAESQKHFVASAILNVQNGFISN